MSTNEQTPLSQPTSAVRNTLGREQAPQNLVRPVFDEDLREYCDKNYHQFLPIIAEKLHQEKAQQEKLKAVKARLNFEEASQYFESETPNRIRNLKERLGLRDARTRSESPEQRHGRSKSPREKGLERRTVFKRLEKGVFHRLGYKEKNVSAHSRGSEQKSYYSSHRDTESCYQSSRSKETKTASKKHHHKREYSRRMEAVSESEGSAGGHWKSKPKNQKSSMEDELSQPWVCEETNPFTPWIRYFDFPKTQMPSDIKTYDGSKDPKDHLKIFQAAVKTKRWVMTTWCHMFKSTLIGNARVWFDDLPKESIDGYDDLRKAFLENYLQQKKGIKDPVEIHNVKQRNAESTKEFVRRYKLECRDIKGALECMKIFRFMHEITNPELIKRLHDKIPKSVDEMMSETRQKQNFKRGNFHNEQRMERKQDRFTLLTKTPREILALDKGKFKPPPSMTTPLEKRNASKFCEFHREELKQNHKKDQEKIAKKGETLGKDKPLAILMVKPWQKIVRQRITQTFSPKSVFSFPTLWEEDGTKGPMIIEAEMGGHWVHRIYVDGGFSLEIFGEIIWPLGQISLLVRVGDEEHSTSAWINFMVARSPFPYNRIIGRPGVRKIRAITSTVHKMIKFPVASGIVTLQSSRIIPLECSMVSEPGVPRSTLTEEGRKELYGLLRHHLDVFAWKPADMIGVPRHIDEHRLNVHEGCLPIRQNKRGQAPERNKAISEEVKKLVEADIMKEVHYHSWLSNPVMVKKHDDSWRMCMDFKDLNKTCPKDGYPLPEIDWKVESLCGYPYKCFLDAYKGYHQINMAEEDEEKTTNLKAWSFAPPIKGGGAPKKHKRRSAAPLFKNVVRTKNAGATYQRLVDKAFQKHIGQNLKVYVDDLVIKIQTEKEVIRDIEETFKTLRKINMKLNPKKYAFGMRECTFLGYKVDVDGLRVSPDNVKAVLDLLSPKCLKDVQKLNGKLASLNRFLSKSVEKSLPFFKTLKKFTKKTTKEAFSTVLMTERHGKQVPVYFVSRALQGPEINYTLVEKLILALVSASERLKRYFQAHTIVVITDQPIKQLLSNPKVTGRLLKWRFELGEHDIQYRPRTSVKGQILADFIVKHPDDDAPDTPMKDREELSDPWILFRDGSSYVDGSGGGLIIKNPEGMEFTYALQFRFNATNNEAEYEALIAGLRIASQMGIQNLQENVDSKLVANQCVGPLQAKYVLREIHEGSCSMHAGPRFVVSKALRSGYLWPTMHTDARNLIRECKDCQVHRLVPRNPQEKLTPITSPWPFYKWGIDIAGPFLEGPSKVKFLIVAIDYFTKWIEARPVATITGTQKPRGRNQGTVGGKNKNWVEEVSHVLWAHRTMIKSSNGETPFSLTYGAEAVIPAEIGMPTLRTAEVDMVKNNEALGISLDLLKEKREQLAIQEARNKVKMEGYYNARVRSTSFRPGDFVYRSKEASHAEDGGKLGPKWEGPYEVTEALGKGAYRIRDRNGHTLPRTWNICNLKKCYMHEM
nr:hypothetical protein [Tanacetum cinerariifolium]